MKFDFIAGENPSYFEALRHDAKISELTIAGTTVRQAQIDFGPCTFQLHCLYARLSETHQCYTA